MVWLGDDTVQEKNEQIAEFKEKLAKLYKERAELMAKQGIGNTMTGPGYGNNQMQQQNRFDNPQDSNMNFDENGNPIGGRRRRRSHKLMGGRHTRRGKRSGKQTGGRKRSGRRTRR